MCYNTVDIIKGNANNVGSNANNYATFYRVCVKIDIKEYVFQSSITIPPEFFMITTRKKIVKIVFSSVVFLVINRGTWTTTTPKDERV